MFQKWLIFLKSYTNNKRKFEEKPKIIFRKFSQNVFWLSLGLVMGHTEQKNIGLIPYFKYVWGVEPFICNSYQFEYRNFALN